MLSASGERWPDMSRSVSHRPASLPVRKTDDVLRAERAEAQRDELLVVLRLCRTAIAEEVMAAGDLDHPTIRHHAKVAKRADAAIRKAEKKWC